MTDRGPWSNKDFEALSWHDVHVHGFRLERCNEEEGSADLVMDIDYILDWREEPSGFLFTVCQAVLRFHSVFALKMSLDYAGPKAGMSPFSLAGIERERIDFATGYRSYRWHIPLNWPNGSLDFEAPEFTQELVGEPQVQSQQFLSGEKRVGGAVA
jgi:hypothetical protein